MSDLSIQPIESLRHYKGIAFPEEVHFRQLLVTGPPGVGKSTMIVALGGWSEEGYLDLGRKHWWRSEILAVRPREIHLGLPFRGLRHAVSVFDAQFLDCEPLPAIDYERIVLPPRNSHFFAVDWYRRYVFDFLLPSADLVYERRSERARHSSHPVDAQLSLSICAAQLTVFRDIAKFLHRQGFQVYLREGDDGRLGRFAAEPQSQSS